MPIHWNLLARRSHRWGAILIALPFLVVIASGILLQLKKDWNWIQPPTQRGQGTAPRVGFDEILAAARTIPAAEIREWGDIERLDVQPRRGIVKVQANNHWELQLDLETGSVLQSAYRRSDLIESIHDGSFFHEAAKLWVFLPTAMVVLVLWITGIYLFILPLGARWKRARKKRMVMDLLTPPRSSHQRIADRSFGTEN